MSRRLKMIGLFGRISSVLWGSFAKETYDFKEPTSGSHPISPIYQRYTSKGDAQAEFARESEPRTRHHVETRRSYHFALGIHSEKGDANARQPA